MMDHLKKNTTMLLVSMLHESMSVKKHLLWLHAIQTFGIVDPTHRWLIIVQNYNIPIANALEILQYCTRPLISARNHMSELDWLLIPTANSHRKLKLHAVVNSQHERMDCILAISEKMNLEFLKTSLHVDFISNVWNWYWLEKSLWLSLFLK